MKIKKMQIFSKKSYFRCFFAGKRVKMRMNQDATRAPSGAVSRAAPAAGNALKNHTLLRFFHKERIRRKKKEQLASLACEFALCFMP